MRKNAETKILLQIFTADEAEVEALPRHRVLAHLEKIGPSACVGYLEHITKELGEAGPDYHDKLVELYLDQARKTPEDPKRMSFALSLSRSRLKLASLRWRVSLAELPPGIDSISARALAWPHAT